MTERIDKVNENLTIIQKKDGLTFGTDAYLLYAFIRGKGNGNAADLGSGSGIISLLCASKNKFKKIYAIEVQEVFYDLIKRNAEQNNLQERVIPICKNVKDVSQFDTEGTLDAVFCNPPYMKTQSGKVNDAEIKYIARHEVLGNIDDFCECASRILKTGGNFYCVWRPDRLTDLICAMRNSKIEPKRIVTVYPNEQSRPCLVLVEGKKGGSSGVFFTKPLIIYKNTGGEYTDELKYIYENGEFDEQYQKA